MNTNQITSMTMPFYSSTVTSFGYSFNNNTVGRRAGQTSFNGQATAMIKSYFMNAYGAPANTVFNVSGKNNKANLKRCFISEPTFSHTNTVVNINVSYYVPNISFITYPINTSTTKTVNNELTKFEKNQYTKLSTALAQLYQKEVNLELTRVYYPYMNSSIFSQYLVHNAPRKRFLKFQEAILKYPSIHCTSLPAHINGIKIQVSGRLVTEKVVPRVTVKSAQVGSFNADTPSALIDYSKYTSKNKLGAFTVKVWISQRKGNDLIK